MHDKTKWILRDTFEWTHRIVSDDAKKKRKKKEKELPETFSEGDNRVVLPFSQLMKRITKLFSFDDTHTLADSIDHRHTTIY